MKLVKQLMQGEQGATDAVNIADKVAPGKPESPSSASRPRLFEKEEDEVEDLEETAGGLKDDMIRLKGELEGMGKQEGTGKQLDGGTKRKAFEISAEGKKPFEGTSGPRVSF